jgi:hypothetical protein
MRENPQAPLRCTIFSGRMSALGHRTKPLAR